MSTAESTALAVLIRPSPAHPPKCAPPMSVQNVPTIIVLQMASILLQEPLEDDAAAP